MKQVLIIGAGGHGKVLADCLLTDPNTQILGFVDTDPSKIGRQILGIPVLPEDNAIKKNFPPSSVWLVNGIGSTHSTEHRRHCFETRKELGFRFHSVIHPSAIIGREVNIGEGAQILAGVVVQPGTTIGNNVILNSRSSIDHDCTIGDHVHIAPGATLSGGVHVGPRTHIGTGSTMIQGVTIGESCLVGAGAIVLKNLPSKSKLVAPHSNERKL